MRARVMLATIALAVGAPGLLASCGSSGSEQPRVEAAGTADAADHEYVIPDGTGERIDDGEQVEIIPAQLEVRVGEVIRLVNHDDRGHVVGVFYVGAGETLTQRFASPGELTGECTIHPSGSFTLTVRA